MYPLGRYVHSHEMDETPMEIKQDDHQLGETLTLRTDDEVSDRDSVRDIRKGDHITLNSGISSLSL